MGERELKMDVWLSIKERVHPGAVVPPSDAKCAGRDPGSTWWISVTLSRLRIIKVAGNGNGMLDDV